MKGMEQIWGQTSIPVIYRRGKGSPLLIKLPYRDDNRIWLQNGKRNKPKWLKQYTCWEVPKAWFDDLVNRSNNRWNSLYIIQPYRQQEICARACWEAKGHECQCSCMGKNHGSQSEDGRWFEVSETFATRWQDQELSCRLITKPS